MKFGITTLSAIAALAAIHAQSPAAFAQGSLTPPPGAPAPVMKSLDQIEARVPISTAPFTITEPGSYYLTQNLSVSSGDAIVIATNSVSLDLNGFTLRSTSPNNNGTAVFLTDGRTGVTIQNGHIRGDVVRTGGTSFSGPGFYTGIAGEQTTNVIVRNVSISGCRFEAISLISGSVFLGGAVVESCTVTTVGGRGIYATIVKNCAAYQCGSAGISASQVSDSIGESVSSAAGIFAVNAVNSSGSSQSGTGLMATTAMNCYGESVSGTGLSATGTASFCRGKRSGGNAIEAAIAIGCTATSGAIVASQKHLGTP